jgi:flagellin-like hook-associated protein FlgL
MQLTNYSFLDSRNNYISARNQQKISANRVSSGNKFENAGTDVGALGQDARLRSERLQMKSKKVALQNFNTFLDTQDQTLQQVRGIYNRMSILAHQALDPTLSESSTGLKGDKDLLNTEFNVLADELDSILNRKVNGQLLFGGKSADFSDGLLDTNATGATPQLTTIDVGTTKGTMTIELSPGQAADQIWMFQGKLPTNLEEYFDQSTYNNIGDFSDPGDTARLAELNGKLYELFESQGIFTTGAWKTQGSADSLNYDKFEVEFNSCDVSVTPTFDTDNGAFGNNLYNTLTANNTLRSQPAPGTSTKITMIGVNSGNTAIYKVKASFTPTLPYNDIVIPSSGETYPAISFGNIDCADIKTSGKAEKVLASLEAEIENLTNSMAQIAASMRRTESEIDQMDNADAYNEAAIGRISDTDYAKESTELAKQSIRMGLATQVMSNTSRLTDVLIPLTTNHFRGAGLSSTL